VISASTIDTVVPRPGRRIKSGHAIVSVANPTTPPSHVWTLSPTMCRRALPSTREAIRMAAAEA
jgi:hypothetical protein